MGGSLIYACPEPVEGPVLSLSKGLPPILNPRIVMSPLTIEEKLIYRNIKRAAIVWLLLLRLDPQPITETTAADILQIDRATARKHLKSLSEIGICTRLGRYNGFILTQTGRQLALPTELENGRGRFSPSLISSKDE